MLCFSGRHHHLYLFLVVVSIVPPTISRNTKNSKKTIDAGQINDWTIEINEQNNKTKEESANSVEFLSQNHQISDSAMDD